MHADAKIPTTIGECMALERTRIRIFSQDLLVELEMLTSSPQNTPRTLSKVLFCLLSFSTIWACSVVNLPGNVKDFSLNNYKPGLSLSELLCI
jgi:hypothetical protein